MAATSVAHWYPTAAYLYTLHLDGPALAWEYLRRNPDYRLDWLRRHRHPAAAQAWGLRLLEDPALDARDAYPVWWLDHDTVVHLHRDVDPPPGAQNFQLWHVPGRKHLTHDGKRLVLDARWPGGRTRFVLGPGLQDGLPYLYATSVCAVPSGRYRAFASALDALTAVARGPPLAQTRARPPPTALLELHTLQALDATVAGASLRDVAEGLFGMTAVAQDWHADSALRARVRRLVRRGEALMRGGYRSLAQLASAPPSRGGR
ncbi:DUF2285 domain-containing protein [Delftia lacustris]|uniref:DUF2285 domain-containing protein n=1 Tax=Delftia lacustris TaxID=558537 RepID=UPI0035A5B496